MKAFIAAVTLVTLMSAPAFAQRYYYYGPAYGPYGQYAQSPASLNYGSNGY